MTDIKKSQAIHSNAFKNAANIDTRRYAIIQKLIDYYISHGTPLSTASEELKFVNTTKGLVIEQINNITFMVSPRESCKKGWVIYATNISHCIQKFQRFIGAK